MRIDAQVHAYERDHPGRPWAGFLHGPPEVTGDQLVAAMDAVGVDGAVLVSPWTLYRYDASFVIDVQRSHPDRIALSKPFDPLGEGVGEQVVEWSTQPGVVSARIMMTGRQRSPEEDVGVDAICAAASACGLPVCVLAWGQLDRFEAVVRRHPDTQFVLDHLGLSQPFEPPVPPEPFAGLPAVLALAAYPNLAIKVTGAATLSHEPFPFDDLWPHLERVFTAFGLDRCLWGTDWTRAVELVTYKEAVDAFASTTRLSEGDREQLMAGSASRVFGWTPRNA